MYKFILFVALSLQCCCLFAQESKQLKSIYEQLSGHFNNYKQRQQLPDSIASSFSTTKPWLNKLQALHIPVNIPSLGKNIIYLEWRDDKGNISRQRLWHFKEDGNGTVIMNFYAFKVDSLFRDIAKDLPRLQQVTLADLVSYPDGCSVIFTENSKTTIGILNPNTCKVVTQRTNRTMQLFARILFTADGFYYSEYGQLPDGSYAFKVPGYDQYWFEKQPD